MSATILNDEILAEFQDLLVELGPPVVQALRPGLSSAEIVELTLPLGIALPIEAAAWWKWHNGATFKPGQPAIQTAIGPGFYIFSLTEAIKYYQTSRQVAFRLASETNAAEFWWEPTWFPVVGLSSGAIACDTAVPPGGPTPLRLVESSTYDTAEFRRVRCESLGDLVTTWIRAIHEGVWEFQDGNWHCSPDPDWEIPRRLGLI